MLLDELRERTADIQVLMSNLPNGPIAPIANAEQFAAYSALLRDVKAIQKRAETEQKSFTQALDYQKKSIITWMRETYTDSLDRTESSLKRAILEYQQEQERKRKEEERRAQEAARKEQERLAKLAERAAARGDAHKAEEYSTRAETVVAAPAAIEQAKASGISMRTVWEFEIVDAEAIPREYLMPDEKKIGAVVRALKGDTSIPGIKVIERKTIAAAS